MKTAAERYDEAAARAVEVASLRAGRSPAGSGFRLFLLEEMRDRMIAAIEAAAADGVAEALMRATERRSVELAAHRLEQGVIEAVVARCAAIARSHTYGLNIMDVSGTAERIAEAIEAAIAGERARCLAIFDEGGWLGAGRSRIERGDAFVQTATNRDNEPGDGKQ